MPKLKRIGRKKIPEIAGHSSLVKIFGSAKPKFYKISGNQIIAAGIISKTWDESHYMMITKFNRKKAYFEPFATSILTPFLDRLNISSASKLPKKYKAIEQVGGKTLKFYAKQKTGLNIFRLFLNEAIALAKEMNLKKIGVSAQNKDLKEYYERFGFKFSNNLIGIFEIK